jgi:hypothetical protein
MCVCVCVCVCARACNSVDTQWRLSAKFILRLLLKEHGMVLGACGLRSVYKPREAKERHTLANRCIDRTRQSQNKKRGTVLCACVCGTACAGGGIGGYSWTCPSKPSCSDAGHMHTHTHTHTHAHAHTHAAHVTVIAQWHGEYSAFTQQRYPLLHTSHITHMHLRTRTYSHSPNHSHALSLPLSLSLSLSHTHTHTYTRTLICRAARVYV